MRGVAGSGVEGIWGLPPDHGTHAQPLPRRPVPAAAICSLNLAKSPKVFLIASPTAPLGSPPALGPIQVQNSEWLWWPPALLRTAVRMSSGTWLIFLRRSSSGHVSSSGCFATAAL